MNPKQQSEQEDKLEMIKTMLEDMGLEDVCHASSKHPFWLIELCDVLIRAGWRKQ